MAISPSWLSNRLSGLAIPSTMLATEPTGLFIIPSVSFKILLIEQQVRQGPTILAYYLTQ